MPARKYPKKLKDRWVSVGDLADLLRVPVATAAAVLPGEAVLLPGHTLARLTTSRHRPVMLSLHDAAVLAGVDNNRPHQDAWRWATVGRVGKRGRRVYLRAFRHGAWSSFMVDPRDLAKFLSEVRCEAA